jgi:uncharacterized tellurite resistance protein B-like protein
MFRTLQELFDTLLPPPRDTPEQAAQRLRLATAVLLVEVMREHADLADAERTVVLAALQREFALTEADSRTLLAEAEATSRSSTDYQSYTSVLNERLDEPQKLRVIEAMWQVAYADGQVDAYENHVLWRIADLLYLPHGGYIAAKMRARDDRAAAGAAPPGKTGAAP